MSDQHLEQTIGTVLRAGVIISAAVVLAGGLWLLATSGRTHPVYQPFHEEPVDLRSPLALIRAVAHPTPAILIQIGLLLLIATPLARVVMCVVAFLAERDRLYVALTSIVLVVLLYSLLVPR